MEVLKKDEKVKITNMEELALVIAQLEQKSKDQEVALRAQYDVLLASLRPKNILKNTLYEVQESVSIKNNVLKILMGLGAGYFSKKIITRNSANVLKKVLGTAVEYGVISFLSGSKKDGSKADGILEKLENFLNKLTDKRNEKQLN